MDADIRELTFQNVLDSVLKPAGVKVGGFPEEIFIDLTSEEAEQWSCSICFLVVKDCRECINNHLFCHTCIFAWSLTCGANSQRCPVCRCEQKIYADSKQVNARLADKRVKCPDKDCSFRGPLKIFVMHSHGRQGFSNSHVDLEGLRPAPSQYRLVMPMMIGFPELEADFSNDVRAQLQQGRMVIHQMMSLLQLEMQLRQRALNSFSEALDTETRMNRLDEVLALNEQLNEVGIILAGLMRYRPRIATREPGDVRPPVGLLPRRQANAPTQHSAVSYNTDISDAEDNLSSDIDPILAYSVSQPSDSRNAVGGETSGPLRLLSRIQLPSRGVGLTQGANMANSDVQSASTNYNATLDVDTTPGHATRSVLSGRSTSATSSSHVAHRETEDVATRVIRQSSPPQDTHATISPVNSTHRPGYLANSTPAGVGHLSPLFGVDLRSTASLPQGYPDVLQRNSVVESSPRGLQRPRLPSLDNTTQPVITAVVSPRGLATTMSRVTLHGPPTVIPIRTQHQAVHGEDGSRRSDQTINTGLTRRTSPERTVPTAIAGVTARRQSVPIQKNIDVNIFRRNRRPIRPKVDQSSSVTRHTPDCVSAATAPPIPAAGTAPPVSAAHSRNLKPIRRRRPPLSIVSDSDSFPSTSGQPRRSRRRSEVARGIMQRQRPSDE